MASHQSSVMAELYMDAFEQKALELAPLKTKYIKDF